jgi:hypothetical protein
MQQACEAGGKNKALGEGAAVAWGTDTKNT